MKKFKILAILAVAATMSLGGAFALTGCDNSDGGHTHSYTKWNYDTEGHHWKECPDDGVRDESTYGEHHFDGDTDTTCECGYVREVEITGTVSGTVTAYGKALTGVKVAVGDKSTTTGSNGKFSLDGITTESEVTVTFSKTGYINVEKKIATSDWTEKATTLDAVMHLTEEKATISGVVKSGGQMLSGAVVTLEGQEYPETTGPDGKYSFKVDCSAAANLTLTVTHSYCEDYSGTVAVAAGSTTVTKDVSLTSKTVPELGGKSLVELNYNSSGPTVAEDYNFVTSGKGSWNVNSDSYEMANEGLLLHEAGQDIASGSKELKLYTYNRFVFDEMQQIKISATRFGDPLHNANLQGFPEVYVVLVASDGTVIKPQEEPGKVEKTHPQFNDLVFTFENKISGVYTLAVGTTRGNRVAIESVKYLGEEITGTVTGTIKQNDAALSGAEVTFGSTTVQTGSDGTFSIDVSVRKGGSDKITVSYDGISMEIPFTSENLASGTYNVGEKVLKAKPLPGISQEQLDALPAAAAPDMSGIDKIKDAIGDNSWLKVGDQSGANEGWLFKDAGYAEEGSTELKVFTYKKLTFDNMGTIIVRARTFGGQNSVSGHDGQIYPEIIIKIIDGDGNTVAVTSTYTKVDSENTCRDYYFKLNGEIKGDYTFAIGMARGMRMAVESIKFSRAMTSVNVTGTVKSSGLPVAGATVKYGYNRGSTVTGTDGSFTLPVDIAEGESVEVTITKDGFADIVKTVSDAMSAAIGEVVFVKTVLPNLTTEDIAGMTVETATSFNQQALNGWRSYGDVDKGHGEGTCLQANANSPAYICAKFTIADGNKFMKFQARMFVRDSDQRGLLQVKVIKADGTVETIAPVRVYHANEVLTDKVLNGNTLINDAEYYTEGVYDLSAYVGQTVVIAIFAVNDVEPVTKSIHNAINNVTFKSNSDTEFGKPAVTE